MQLGAFVMRTSSLLSRIAASANFSLESDQDQATFNRAIISWLKNPDSSLPHGHITGLCCSSLLSIQFTDESRGSDDLIPEFRSFVLAASLAHRGRRNSSKGSSSSSSRQKQQAYPARHESRSHLIRRLGAVLTPQYLSSLSSESCQVLFHLVLGAVLGMGHSPSPSTTTSSFFNSSSSSRVAPSNLLSSEFQQSPTLWLSTKNQLIRTLAQDLVFLGSNKLGISLEGTADLEKLIIDMATSRWNEMESRIWVDSIGAAEKAPNSTGQGPAQQQPMPLSPLYSPSRSCCDSNSKRRRRFSSSSTADDDLDQDQDQDRNPPYWEDPPPTPPPPTVEPTLIPVMPPSYHDYQFQFQVPGQYGTSSSSSSWSENPASYLEMTDEPESYYLATANENNKRGRAAAAADLAAPPPPPPPVAAMPRSMTDPFPLGTPSDGNSSFFLVLLFYAIIERVTECLSLTRTVLLLS